MAYGVLEGAWLVLGLGICRLAATLGILGVLNIGMVVVMGGPMGMVVAGGCSVFGRFICGALEAGIELIDTSHYKPKHVHYAGHSRRSLGVLGTRLASLPTFTSPEILKLFVLLVA